MYIYLQLDAILRWPLWEDLMLYLNTDLIGYFGARRDSSEVHPPFCHLGDGAYRKTSDFCKFASIVILLPI